MADKKQKAFEIGQIVYVLSDKAEAIVPAIVVEEVVVKKLDGNTTSWKVAVGPPSKKKIVASDELSGEIYTSLDEVKSVMKQRFDEFVQGLVNQAEHRTKNWYGQHMNKGKKKQNEETSEPGSKIDPATLLDPSMDEQQQQQPQQRIKSAPLQSPAQSGDPKEALRSRLRNLATADEEDESGQPAEGGMVTLEDGRQVPVHYNTNPKEGNA